MNAFIFFAPSTCRSRRATCIVQCTWNAFKPPIFIFDCSQVESEWQQTMFSLNLNIFQIGNEKRRNKQTNRKFCVTNAHDFNYQLPTTNYSSCSPTNDLFSQNQIVTMLHEPRFELEKWGFCCCYCHFNFIHLCNCTQIQNVLFARKHDNIFLDSLKFFSNVANVAREGFWICTRILSHCHEFTTLFLVLNSFFVPQYLLLNSVVHLKSISFGMNTNESSTIVNR